MIGPAPQCLNCKFKLEHIKCSYYGLVPQNILLGGHCRYWIKKEDK